MKAQAVFAHEKYSRQDLVGKVSCPHTKKQYLLQLIGEVEAQAAVSMMLLIYAKNGYKNI